MKNLNKTESYLKRETSNSSLIYEGSVMTLQLTNNSDSEMNETISSELPYLNKTECEELLKTQEYLDNSNEILIMNLVLKNNEDNKETQVQSSTLTSTLLISSNNSNSNNTISNSSFTISALNSTTCSSLNALFPINSYSQLNISLMNEIMNITGEDIFDYNSSFYSDICTIYNENESDVTLQERLKKFTVYIECDNNCHYAGINNGTYAKCICESTNDIKNTNSTYSYTSTNIKVLTNYNYHNYSSANDYYIEFNQINQLGVDDDDFFIDVSSNLFLIKCGKEAFLESNILLNIGFEVYLIITTITIGISFCECWKNHDFIYRFKAEIKSRDWNEFCEHIVKVTKKKNKTNEIEMRDIYDKDNKIKIGYNEHNNEKYNKEGGYKFFYKSSIYEKAVKRNSSCNNLTNITNINNLTNNTNVNSFLRRVNNVNANTNNTNGNSHFINNINSNNNLNNKLLLRKRKSQLLRSNSSKDLKTLSIIKLNDLTSSNNFMLSSNDNAKNKKKESIKSINSFNTHNNSNDATNIDNNPLVRDSIRNYKTNINMINSIIRNMGKRKSKFSSNNVNTNSSANDSNFDSSNVDLIRNKGEIEKLKNNTSTLYSKIISNASSNTSSNESKKIKKSSRERVNDRKNTGDTNNNADNTYKSNSLIRVNSIIAKNNRFSQLSKNSETNMYFIFKNRLSIKSIKSTDKSNENNDNDDNDNTCNEAQLRMLFPKDSKASITNFNTSTYNTNTFNSRNKSISESNSNCRHEIINYFTTIVEDNPEIDDVTEKKKSIDNDLINNNNYYTHSQVKKISEWNINDSLNEVFNINNYNSNNNNNSKANKSCLSVLNITNDNNNSKESSRGSNNCIEEADLSLNKNICNKNILSDEIIRRYSNNSSNNNEDTTARNLLNTEHNTEINIETNINSNNIKDDPNNNTNKSPYYQRRKQVKNLTQKRKSNNKILRNKLSQINKQFDKYRNNKNTNNSKDKKDDNDNSKPRCISENGLENVIENNNTNNANASQQTISTITSTTNNTPSIYNQNSSLNYNNKNRLNTDVDDNKQSYIYSHRPLLTQIEIDNSFVDKNKKLNNYKLIDEDNNNDDDSIVKEFKLPKIFDFNSLFYNNYENIVKSSSENYRRVVNDNDNGKNQNYDDNELEFVAKSNLFKRESSNVMIDYYKNAEAQNNVVVNINCNNNSRDNSFWCNNEINNNSAKINIENKINKENRANSTLKEIDIFKTPKKNDINNISQYKNSSLSKSNNKSIRTKSRLPTNFSISKPKLINSNELKYKKKNNNNIILETDNKINLPYFQKLSFDERTHWEYFKAEVKINHIVFNLLYVKSLVEPFTIRLYDFFFELSICFALNAIFFTDSVIESRNDYKKTHFGSQLNFMFTLIEEYWKSIISSILQIIIIIIVDVIRKPGDKQKIELLNAIKSEDVESIKDNK